MRIIKLDYSTIFLEFLPPHFLYYSEICALNYFITFIESLSMAKIYEKEWKAKEKDTNEMSYWVQSEAMRRAR